MTRAWAGLRVSADGLVDALSRNTEQVVEAYYRSRVELARAELREGDFGQALGILQQTVDSVDVGEEGHPVGRDLLLAIALSVLAQGQEQYGRPFALENFEDSVAAFRRIESSHLGPRDRCDFGIALAATGQTVDATTELVAARAGHSITAEGARTLAVLLAETDEAASRDLLSQALLVSPTDADALRLLGRFQSRRGDPLAAGSLRTAIYALLVRERPEEALALLDDLERVQPSTSEELAGVRGEATRLAGRPAEAVPLFASALTADPDNVWLLARYALALVDQDEFANALALARRGLELHPDDLVLLDVAQSAAAAMGDHKGAVSLANRLLRATGGVAYAHGRLVRALVDGGRLPEARTHLATAREANPLDPQLLELDLDLALVLGDTERAVALCRHLCSLPTTDLSRHAQLVGLLGSTGRLDEAEAAAARARQLPGGYEDLGLVEALAEAAAANGRPDRVVELLEPALAGGTASAAAALMFAEALAAIGETDAALALAEQVAATGAPGAVGRLANLYAASDRFDEARRAAEEALAAYPMDLSALLALGRIHLFRDDDPSGAARILARVIDEDPGDAEARILLAMATAEDEPERALLVLDGLTREQQLEDLDVMLLRAHVLMTLDRVEEAHAELVRATELYPESALAWADLGDTLRLSGEPRQGLEAAERSIALDQDSGYAYVVRSLARREIEDVAGARQDLLRAIDLEPENGQAHILLAQLPGDIQTRMASLDVAESLGQPKDDVDLERAAILVSEDPETALLLYERLAASGLPSAVAGRIDTLMVLGRLSEAVELAQSAVQEIGEDPLLVRALGVSLVSDGRFEEGLAPLRGLAQSQGDEAAWGDVGWALGLAGQTGEALDAFDRALAGGTPNTWLLGQVARALATAGSFDQSSDASAQWVARADTDAEAWGALGWALAHAQGADLSASERAFDRAWTLPAEEPDPWYLKSRGEVRFVQGQRDAARADLEMALTLAERSVSNRPWLASTRAWCHYRLGDLVSAARTYQEARALADKPGSDDFDLALVTLCAGRATRALAYYDQALAEIGALDPLEQRGVLTVALVDLDRMSSRDVSAKDALAQARALLGEFLGGLPTARRLQYLEPRRQGR